MKTLALRPGEDISTRTSKDSINMDNWRQDHQGKVKTVALWTVALEKGEDNSTEDK